MRFMTTIPPRLALCTLLLNLAACGGTDANTSSTANKALDKASATAVANANQPIFPNSTESKNPVAANDNPSNSKKTRCDNRVLFEQYQQQNTGKTQVLGCGQIIKVLPDDNEGSRHQRLLVRIDNYPQITVLIAHNIDLAPRVADVKAKQPISFYGEYIYNDKGGVVHWTHKDPAARHQDGWLDYQGKRYW